MKKDHQTAIKDSEKILVKFALENDLYLSLGDYGSGRTLVLKDDPKNFDDLYRKPKKRGDWLYSSEGCW